jgi:PAS domain S-box-containing protein
LKNKSKLPNFSTRTTNQRAFHIHYSGSSIKQKETALQVEVFVHQIESMRSRVALLNQKANQLSLPPQNFLEESFVELSTALEQLQVAQEELLQQDEELATTRQALETQRQRYQELFNFAPDAYLVTDAQGTIQQANCAAAILLNISQQSLVGKVLASFIPLEERKALRSRLKQLGNKIGSVQEWEVRLYPRNGKPCDAAFRVAAFQDREHESVSLRCVVRDITLAKQTEKALQTAKQELEMKVEERTAQLRCANERLRGEIAERQQAEAALRESEERFRSLSACSPVGIFLTDVEGRCTYTNPRCQVICGFTLEESLGEGWSESVHPEDRQRVFADWSDYS